MKERLMADDLEAFLRQAAQRRAQRQAGVARPAAPAPPPPKRPLAPAPTAPAPRAPLAPPPARSTPPNPVVTAEVVRPPETSRLGTRVNTSGFDQRAGQLGEEVGLADEHMDAHISEKFDHHVGSLDAGDAQQGGAGAGDLTFDVNELVAMLKEPQSLRYAVLLSEILNSPHFRR
jgi:hypothetical protein